jgi:hypothetical protein
MGLLDPVFRFLAGLGRALDRATDTVDDATEAVTNPSIDGQQASEVVGEVLADVTPADEVGSAIVDVVEESILNDLQDAGQLTPENVERVADQTEGGAMAVLTGLGISGSAVEAASLGQVDQHQEYITQAIAGLGVDDVTGLELDARIQEGILPALEAKVAAEHRAKFADLGDVVEADLRTKDSDRGYTRDLSTYGIRPQDVETLEAVALSEMEFEELIETPAELGLIVPDDVLEQQLDLAGYPEKTKEFLSQVNERIPRTKRAFDELIRVEGLSTDLDTLVEEGDLEPAAAADVLASESPADREELIRRFELRRGLSAGGPTQAEVEDGFLNGFIGEDEAVELLNLGRVDVDAYPWVLRQAIYDELDGDLQEAVATGKLDEERFANLAESVGVDDGAVEAFLSGLSKSDLVDRRLAGGGSTEERSVRTIVGIGDSRASALEAADLGTVRALANADVEEVAETVDVSPETAEGFIRRARERLSGGSE